MFFCEFGKTSKNIFDRAIPDDRFLTLSVDFEVFQNISFTEHLWETANFMYKLHYFNQQIQWKLFRRCLFKHCIQEHGK